MPSPTVAQLTDEHGQWSIDADGNVTLLDTEGNLQHFNVDGTGSILHPDGSYLTLSTDQTWKFNSTDGRELTWSNRDERWISFKPEVDGSRWEHDLRTGFWIERETPHTTRPQGEWVSPDGRTVVTEVNHNLFMVADGHYYYRLNYQAAQHAPLLAHEWREVPHEVWLTTLSNNQDLEMAHHSPGLEAGLRYADNLNYLTTKFGEYYVEIGMMIAPQFGLVGRAMGWAWEATTAADALDKATTPAEKLQIIIGVVEGHMFDLMPGPGPHGGHGRHLQTPDAPSGLHTPATPHAGADTPGASIPPTRPGPDVHPTQSHQVAEPRAAAPEAPGPATPAPDRPPAANPFEPPALTKPIEPVHTPQKHTDSTTPIREGVTVNRLEPGPSPTHGEPIHVKQEPVPDGLHETGRPHRLSVVDEDKASAALRAALGEPPGPHHHAHHIVPVKEGGSRLDDLRDRMHEAGIGRDTAENGLYLPKSPQRANPDGGVPHGTVHRNPPDDYAYTIDMRLKGKEGEALKRELAVIKEELQDGRFQLREAPADWSKPLPEPHGGTHETAHTGPATAPDQAPTALPQHNAGTVPDPTHTAGPEGGVNTHTDQPGETAHPTPTLNQTLATAHRHVPADPHSGAVSPDDLVSYVGDGEDAAAAGDLVSYPGDGDDAAAAGDLVSYPGDGDDAAAAGDLVSYPGDGDDISGAADLVSYPGDGDDAAAAGDLVSYPGDGDDAAAAGDLVSYPGDGDDISGAADLVSYPGDGDDAAAAGDLVSYPGDGDDAAAAGDLVSYPGDGDDISGAADLVSYPGDGEDAAAAGDLVSYSSDSADYGDAMWEEPGAANEGS